jgi:glycosyltransferase involved in cell wall biosynthesis
MENAVWKSNDGNQTENDSVLLCFSHLRWDFVYQRPQHIMTLASNTKKVVYFEEPVFEDVQHAFMRINEVGPSVKVVTPVLKVGTGPADIDAAQRRLLDLLVASTPQNLLTTWYYTPMALRFSDHIRCDVCVYDCMDELSAFKNAPPELVEMERRLLERADVVFTGGQSLYEAKKGMHGSMFPFPSSIDFTHFHQARGQGHDPVDQQSIPHPRVGYFGVIDERLDVDLLARTAQSMPDIHFVMIGPVVKIDPAGLPRADNLHWLGGKSYAELPSYLRHWDAGWMPFALNAATRYISPTKTPEFLAAGVPLVSTAIVDVVRTYGAKGLVDIVDAGDVEDKLRALLVRPRDSLLKAVDAYLMDMSWENTWIAMAGHIQRVRSTRNVLRFRRSA